MDSNVLRLGGAPLPGLGYPPLAAFTMPVTTGWTGAFYFGSGRAIARKNFAGGPDAGWAGNPVEHDGYMTLSGNAYLQTLVAESAEQTILAIARRPNTGASIGIVGTYLSNADAGVCLFAQTPNNRYSATIGKAGGSSTVVFVDQPTEPWRLLEVSVPAAGPHFLRDHTSGLTAYSGDVTARAPSDRPYRAGRLYSGGFSGEFDIAALLIRNQVLDEIERTEMVAWAREDAAGPITGI